MFQILSHTKNNKFFLTESVLNLYDRFDQYVKKMYEYRTDNPTIDDIGDAIINRQYVGIYYEGSDEDSDIVEPGFRLIEPYVLGRGYSLNKEVRHPNRLYLRAYTIKSTESDPTTRDKFKARLRSVSKTKRVPYWRLFRVDRIRTWETFDKTFSRYRELYNPDDKQMATIIYKIEKEEFPYGQRQLVLPKKLRYK